MDKEELLKIAKEKYPIGTVMVSDYSLKMCRSREKSTYTITDNQKHYWVGDNLQLTSNSSTPYVYYKGKWAEIISIPNKSYELW